MACVASVLAVFLGLSAAALAYMALEATVRMQRATENSIVAMVVQMKDKVLRTTFPQEHEPSGLFQTYFYP